MYKLYSCLISLFFTILLAVVFPDPIIKLEFKGEARGNSFVLGYTGDDKLVAERIRPILRKDLGPSAIYCLRNSTTEKGMFGVSETNVFSKNLDGFDPKKKALSLIISDTCNLSRLNTEATPMLIMKKSNIPFLNFGKVEIFADKRTVEEVAIKQFAKDLANENSDSSSGNINAKILVRKIFDEETNTDKILKGARNKARINTAWHHVIWFVGIWSLIELIRVRTYKVRKPPSEKSENVSLSKFFREMISSLPTIGLIGTMVGLVSTLDSFITRDSLDTVTAAFSNSAALGGITLALTTTILAACLGLLITVFIAPLLGVNISENGNSE